MAKDKKPPKGGKGGGKRKYTVPQLIVQGSILAITAKAWEAQALVS